MAHFHAAFGSRGRELIFYFYVLRRGSWFLRDLFPRFSILRLIRFLSERETILKCYVKREMANVLIFGQRVFQSNIKDAEYISYTDHIVLQRSAV